MAVEVNLLVNCDDAIVLWRIAKRIKNCWGFSIDREKRLDNGMTIEGVVFPMFEHGPVDAECSLQAAVRQPDRQIAVKWRAVRPGVLG